MKFRISYEDPKTQEQVVIVDDFENFECAEDYAYTVADKGPHEVEEVS